MNVGIIDVDGRNFPNFALMKISAYHKAQGHDVEWAIPLCSQYYDLVYKSKIFTFSKDEVTPWPCKIVKGGTGYDIQRKLPPEIEQMAELDYSIYPNCDYSLQFFSRGCIRQCKFCLVQQKEGYITPVEPVAMNPRGKHIEVLDNNFFANPEWRYAVDFLMKAGQPVNIHGVDVRIMDEEQAFYLNKMRLQKRIHIAWDIPTIDLTDKLREVIQYLKPWKLTCYVLIGFDSTIEQDSYRIERLRELGVKPFVMPYRDYENNRIPSQYERDLAHYVNRPEIFNSTTFAKFEPRKGFLCSEYLAGTR